MEGRYANHAVDIECGFVRRKTVNPLARLERVFHSLARWTDAQRKAFDTVFFNQERTCLVSMPRHSGRTTLLAGMAAAYLVAYGPGASVALLSVAPSFATRLLQKVVDMLGDAFLPWMRKNAFLLRTTDRRRVQSLYCRDVGHIGLDTTLVLVDDACYMATITSRLKEVVGKLPKTARVCIVGESD